jgi:CheY-like chemotaxis protein
MAHVLIVDDEVDLLKLCQLTLQDAGYQAEIVTGGRAALERAHRSRPDLLVIDWVIADMDGNTLMASLKGMPETRDIPVLGISALRDGAMRAELAGVERFLAKPFRADQLVDAVNQVLTQTAARRRGDRGSVRDRS